MFNNWLMLLGSTLLFGQALAQPVSGIDSRNFDPSIRPQDDIYHAVNGGWIKQAVIPASEANDGTLKQLRDLSEQQCHQLIEQAAAHPTTSAEAQKIGDFYHSFMNEARLNKLGLTPLRADLAAIDRIKNKTDLAYYLGQIQASVVGTPMAFYVSMDPKNAQAYLAGLYQSGLAMPDRDYYLSQNARFKPIRKAYLAYLNKLFKFAGYDQPQRRAQQVFDLETHLAQIQWTNVANRDPQKTYNRQDTKALAQLAPGFDWPTFLAAAGVPKLNTVNINQPSYIQAVTKHLNNEPLTVWRNYLIAHTLSSYAPYLNSAFSTAYFSFYGKVLIGTTQQRARWKRGVQIVEQNLGEALGKLYIAKYFPPENKAKIEHLVHNLMQAYHQSIETLSWMTPTTKQAAQKKLSQYELKIGYPNKWRDYSTLIVKPDDLAGNIKRAQAFEYQRQLSRLGTSVDKEEWDMTPQTVNAYYSPPRNEIVFPAAILQPPFFNVMADDAVNYGAIGAIIGHEISHGFDDQGSQYDGNGNLNNWWTTEDRMRFNALTQRLVEQYAAYEPLPGKHINGELTLGENIADNAGLQIAYKAYQLALAGKLAPIIDGMSADQRFFYGFAQVWREKRRTASLLAQLVSDPHAPGQFRAIGAIGNSEAFFKAFDVKQGDRMFKPKDQRIKIW